MVRQKTDADSRLLDKTVAEVVMGWTREDIGPTPFWRASDGWVHDSDSIPPFTSDTDTGWAAMRLVVERMREMGWRLYCDTDEHDDEGYYVQFAHVGPSGFITGGHKAPSLPRAVAEAAIRAMEAKDE